MRGLLSVVLAVCILAFVVLPILPQPLLDLHPVGHGGILVPAGDGDGGDH